MASNCQGIAKSTRGKADVIAYNWFDDKYHPQAAIFLLFFLCLGVFWYESNCCFNFETIGE